ncbi:MAG TPA: FG-GAP repeat protein [Herpetosiphonaceae bacterium]|nr:FG-GAP repeat protein [Herpetosiphonaceae bacterium]
MSRGIALPAIRHGRIGRYLSLLLGLLLILGPLSTQAVPPRPGGAEGSAAPLSNHDWAAIRTLLPEAASGAVTPETYFKASNPGYTDTFGWSIALSGNMLVVGAPGEASAATGINGDQSNDDASMAGAAYVFVRSGTIWTQQAYLKASNTDRSDSFGNAVAISGNTIVVGAPSEDGGLVGDQNDNSLNNAGAAYVFVRTGTTWTQQA